MTVMNSGHRSWFEATARARIAGIVDAGSFREIMPPSQSALSPHLTALDLPGAFDDGVIIGRGMLENKPIFIVGQEGRFMGGAVGEIHGAKIVGLLRCAVRDSPSAVLFLIDSGGVRLHEANAGLIAISEIMRAVLDVRAAGIPVIALVGGSCGAFGGMGIVAKLCSAVLISEEGRLALSGPEVIETVVGVEEFDSKDRSMVWRVTGGKHRYLMGDCADLIEDGIAEFRCRTINFLAHYREAGLSSLVALRATQSKLEHRLATYGQLRDGLDVWARLGVKNPETVPMLDRDSLVALKNGLLA